MLAKEAKKAAEERARLEQRKKVAEAEAEKAAKKRRRSNRSNLERIL